MKNKQVIEQLTERSKQATEFLYRDIDSNKPHMTVDYIKNQLGTIIQFLDTQQQYLDLED